MKSRIVKTRYALTSCIITQSILEDGGFFKFCNVASFFTYQVLYLRNFPKLKSLNLAGNPMCERKNFTNYVYAFLPCLVFFEYAMIHTEEKEQAKEMFL